MNIKKIALLTAVISVFFTMGSLSAQAVNFAENEKGVKTWTFELNEGYTEDRKNFVNGTTYYASNDYTTTKPEDLSDYLTLEVKESETVESKQNKALYLNQTKNSTSSVLTWTAPQDGTISVTSSNDLNLYVNSEYIFTCKSYIEGEGTKTYTVKKDDEVKMNANRYGGIVQLTFTPDTYSAAYQFTNNASELKGSIIKVTSTAGDKKIKMDDLLPQITGNTEVVFGLIIDNIPNSVDVTGAEILK